MTWISVGLTARADDIRRRRSRQELWTDSRTPRCEKTSSRTCCGISTPTQSGESLFFDRTSFCSRRADATLCFSFHETFPDRLVKLQDAHWIPLIEWVEKTYDVKIELYESILNTRQPDATVLKLGSVVSDFDAFKLAGAYPHRPSLLKTPPPTQRLTTVAPT